MDAPKGPAILGAFFGGAAAAGGLELAQLPTLLEGCELGDARRKFAGAALKALKEAQGEAGAAAAVAAAGLKASPLLDPQEFDEPETPSTAEWLKAEGLAGLQL